MGKSVSDFKAGRVEIYRDRIRADVETGAGTDWFTNPPAIPVKYGYGSLSRCVDQSHPMFYRTMRLKRAGGAYIPKRGSKGTATKVAVPKGLVHGLRNVDIGGPFAKESSTLTSPPHVDIRIPGTKFAPAKGYTGFVFPSNDYKLMMLQAAVGNLPAIPSELGIDRTDLMTLGSTAIKRSIPDVPKFSLFRFAGELREGLPKIPLTVLAKERKLRNVGGEYLNIQFGIMPIISDLQNLFEAIQSSEFRASVHHAVGEEHRVRKVLEKNSTSSTRVLTLNEAKTASGATAVTGTLTTTSSVRVWSSCSFAYYQASELDRLLTEFDEMLGKLGVTPTAIDIWNLLPWSWLIDWFTNFNHVITNLSFLGRDGLYLQRGYLMAHYEDRRIYRSTGLLYGIPFETIGTHTCERKYRIGASPFGFGYTWKDFNPFQLSILGALGVSRLRF